MRPIPPKMRQEMADDPYYKKCARAAEGGCRGRIEWHHAIILAGRQHNEKWAILPACHYHHVGEGKDDQRFRCIALSRATEEEIAKYPKTDWKQQIEYCKTIM